MGYIKLDIIHENKIRKFVFIHGAYIDTIWSAKFVDDSNCIVQTFEGEDMMQCLKKFAKFLHNYCSVIDITGEYCESGVIEILYGNLQQLS